MSDPASSWLTPWRVRTYGYALCAALGLAFLFVSLGLPLVSPAGDPLGGDYSVFYAGGSLVAAGRADELYEAGPVAEAQARAVGREALPKTLAYVYPPIVAAAHAPLALLPYRAALVLHALLAVLALGLGLWALARWLPGLEARGPALAWALVAYPLLRSVAGGQNTAFSLALLSGALALLLAPPSPRRELGAGLLLGLLCYKPNFGLPFLGLCLLLGRPRVLLGGALGAAGIYLGSALVGGWAWPRAWAARVAEWRVAEAARNGDDLISLPGVGEELWGPAGASLGLALALGVALGLALLFWRRGRSDLAGCWGVATCGVLLLSPHTQFYDAGLLALPAWILAARGGVRAAPGLAALLLLSWSHPLTGTLPVQPLFGLVLLAAGLAWRGLAPSEPPQPAADGALA